MVIHLCCLPKKKKKLVIPVLSEFMPLQDNLRNLQWAIVPKNGAVLYTM